MYNIFSFNVSEFGLMEILEENLSFAELAFTIECAHKRSEASQTFQFKPISN